jgi:hypothetical protein
MISDRVRSAAGRAVLSTALLLLGSACERQGAGETEQGAAPSTDESTAAEPAQTQLNRA